MRFFLDNCLPPRVAYALNHLSQPDDSVTHLRERFSPDISDPQWLGALGDEVNWIVVSSDLRITKNPVNKKAWQQAGLTSFFPAKSWSNHKMWDQAWRIVRWWPDIMRFAKHIEAGAAFIVPVNYGKLRPLSVR